MFESDESGALVHYLTEQGFSWSEIETIFGELRDYERRIVHESVFDSIAGGTFSIQAILRSALPDEGAGKRD